MCVRKKIGKQRKYNRIQKCPELHSIEMCWIDIYISMAGEREGESESGETMKIHLIGD